MHIIWSPFESNLHGDFGYMHVRIQRGQKTHVKSEITEQEQSRVTFITLHVRTLMELQC